MGGRTKAPARRGSTIISPAAAATAATNAPRRIAVHTGCGYNRFPLSFFRARARAHTRLHRSQPWGWSSPANYTRCTGSGWRLPRPNGYVHCWCGMVSGLCQGAQSMRWSTPPTELREARQDGAGRGLTLSDTCGLGRGQRPRGWQTPLHRLRPITQRGSRLSGSALRKSRVQGRRN